MFVTVASGAALVIGGCASGVGGAGGPPPLRIDSPDFRFAASSMPMPVPEYAAPMYVDSSVLPTALMRAQVWTWPAGSPPAREVAVLASELGLAGDPRRVADGWQVARSGTVLRVYDDPGWPWFYTTEKTPASWLDQTCARGGLFGPYFTCNGRPPSRPPSPPPSGSPSPTIAAPSPNQARSVAQRLLTSLGVTGPVRVRNTGNDGITTLDGPPSFQGMPTGGFPIEIQVDAGGVVSVAGPLATPKPGAAYPLISAEQAFELSNGLMPAQCFAEPAPTPSPATPTAPAAGCQAGHSQSLTGALLGLHLEWQRKHPILLPAWFFTVEDGNGPVLATVAIDRAYLQDATSKTSPASTPVSTSPMGPP